MCGIAGGVAFTNKGLRELSKIENSISKLRKRGPDGCNFFLSDGVALGHTRLSIIDVSENANQPMWDSSRRYSIVFNGEILNFHSLAKAFLSPEEQLHLRTKSDTEVLLTLYIKKEEEVLRHLDGFFAFALYDNVEKKLVLARDRFGKKPVHIYQDEDKLVFASELKALLEFEIPRKLDYTSLFQYLQLNYIPQPKSILLNVRKLPAGNILTVSQAHVQEKCYYQTQIKEDQYNRLSYPSAQKELVNLMEDAVQKRLISDVPLGAFLSGGIDSSVVVALASRFSKGLSTFSIGYKDNPFFDETYYANLVAKKYNTNHTVFSLSTNDFFEHICSVLDYIDEPFADSSAIPQFILSYYTRKHVTVALSGDGGDEVFGGYNKHLAEYKIRKRNLINTAIRIGYPVLGSVPKSRNSKVANLARQLYRYGKGARLGVKERYWEWASVNNESVVDDMLLDQIKNKINETSYNHQKAEILRDISDKDLNSILLTDLKLVLSGDMLVKVDLMSMANSLEVRSPFLDHHVVDFAFSLPAHYKIDGKMKKKIVQDAFKDYLPAELYNRPKKGFEIPLLGWFRNELWSLINDDLLSEKTIKEQGIFEYAYIQQLKKKLKSGNPGDTHATIWALLVFQHWFKRYNPEL